MFHMFVFYILENSSMVRHNENKHCGSRQLYKYHGRQLPYLTEEETQEEKSRITTLNLINGGNENGHQFVLHAKHG